MAEPDLSLVTDDELVTELGKRYDGVVVVGERSRTATTTQRYCNYKGSPIHALGLVAYASAFAMSQLKAFDTDDDEGPENA